MSRIEEETHLQTLEPIVYGPPSPTGDQVSSQAATIQPDACGAFTGITVGIATDRNSAARESQQDAVGTAHFAMIHPVTGRLSVHVGIVADGLGGHENGEYASGLACSAIPARIASEAQAVTDRSQFPEITHAVCSDVNRQILSAPPSLSGAATTAAIIVAVESERLGRFVAVSSIGDSRVYGIARDQSLRQLTRDHSLVQDLIDAGEITPDEALFHPDCSLITAALGARPTISELTTSLHKIADYIAIIALSDGAWAPLLRSLRDAFPSYLADIALSVAPRQAAERIVADAIRLGSEDNASAAILRIATLEPEQTTTGENQ